MILKWPANFWLRCQKPSPPVSHIQDGHWCRSVLERWIHFALHGPMDDAQPQGFPEIPEHQELLKQRQPARSGEPFMTKRPTKKYELNRVWLWNSNVFYTICGLKKVLKSFFKEIQQQYQFSIIAIPSNTTSSSKTCCLLQSMRSMADPSHQGTWSHWSGPVGYSEVKHQKD